MDLGQLADRIREKIDAGALPNRLTEGVWAGLGDERLCLACGARILPTQTRFELDVEALGRTGLHLGCYQIWLAELDRRGLG